MECYSCYSNSSVFLGNVKLAMGVRSAGRCSSVQAELASKSVTVRSFEANFRGSVKFNNVGPFGVDTKNKNGKARLGPVASAGSGKCHTRKVFSPMEPQSEEGKLLSHILQYHRHLFNGAVSEQIEKLSADRAGAIARQELCVGNEESLLHRRVAELREKECQVAIEEVMYMLIVHKFSEINVPMVPRLSKCIKNGKADTWSCHDSELEAIHDWEARIMVKDHLNKILGRRSDSSYTLNSCVMTLIGRLQLGKLYASSVMYGYFLESACRRYHLEKSLHVRSDHPLFQGITLPDSGCWHLTPETLIPLGVTEEQETCCGDTYSSKTIDELDSLKRYITGFNAETFQRCAALRSKEAVNLVEKHSWALFGECEEEGEEGMGEEQDEVLLISISSLKRLVLEAVAFGLFLYNVEAYVDPIYRLEENH
ncbi:hypothetical protein AMTRI_Chr06g172920 [Amborella trichopoda]